MLIPIILNLASIYFGPDKTKPLIQMNQPKVGSSIITFYFVLYPCPYCPCPTRRHLTLSFCRKHFVCFRLTPTVSETWKSHPNSLHKFVIRNGHKLFSSDPLPVGQQEHTWQLRQPCKKKTLPNKQTTEETVWSLHLHSGFLEKLKHPWLMGARSCLSPSRASSQSVCAFLSANLPLLSPLWNAECMLDDINNLKCAHSSLDQTLMWHRTWEKLVVVFLFDESAWWRRGTLGRRRKSTLTKCLFLASERPTRLKGGQISCTPWKVANYFFCIICRISHCCCCCWLPSASVLTCGLKSMQGEIPTVSVQPSHAITLSWIYSGLDLRGQWKELPWARPRRNNRVTSGKICEIQEHLANIRKAIQASGKLNNLQWVSAKSRKVMEIASNFLGVLHFFEYNRNSKLKNSSEHFRSFMRSTGFFF